MPFQCPHCQNTIVVEGERQREVVCSSCGSSILLDPAATTAWMADEGRKRLGKFEFLEQIGVGGFGTVFKARDTELNRIVALKIPRSGSLPRSEDTERFLREARSSAKLKHPGIVALYDAVTIDGVFCLVSEFIFGVTLNQRLTAKRFSFKQAAELIAQVADALHYAHEHDVVHRDLKPANIMLDLDGRPHIMDFGLAKSAADEISMTLEGQVLGTPAYMSPEQAKGEVSRIDARSDVYSLGVILYQLLTGELPFRGEQRMVLLQVMQDEPRPPRRLNDRIPRDLETVCLKAMAKEPGRRYATAGEFNDDLRRFLKGEPITARPVGRWERARRWYRRNRVVATLSALILVLLVAVAVGSTVAVFHISAARDDEQRERRRAEANAELSHQGLVQLQVTRGLQLMDDGDLFRALAWFTRALELDAGRPEEEMHRIRLTAVLRQCPRLTQLWCHAKPTFSVEFSPDGRRVVTASEDGTAQIWDVASGAAVCPPLRHKEMVTWAAFSPDGRSVLTTSGDGTARVWDATTGQPITAPLQHARAVWLGSFSRDSRFVATASADRTARVWDAATGQAVTPPLTHDGDVSQAAFSPDGRFVVTASEDKTAKIWEANSGRLHVPPLAHTSGVDWADFSPERPSEDEKQKPLSRHLLTLAGNTASVWDAQTGRASFPPRKLHGNARSGAFSSDGRHAVVAGGDTAQILDLNTGQFASVEMHHATGIWFVAISSERPSEAEKQKPLSRRIATVGGNASRLWDVTTGQPLTPLLKHNGLANHAAFSPDGRFLATTGGDTANVWDTSTVQPAVTTLKPGQELDKPAFSADRRYLTTQRTSTEPLSIWDTLSGELIPTAGKFEGSHGFCGFGNEGKWLLTAQSDHSACVWELASGQLLFRLPPHGATVRSIALSPDNRLAVTACEDKTARVWELATGQPRGPVMEHADFVLFASFSPDGRHVLTRCADWTAQVWDWTTGQRIGRALKHGGPLFHVSFSPDGRRVVTGSHDRTARVWDSATGEPLTPPLPHRGQVLGAAFSPDGRYVATATADNSARVWEAASGLPLTLPLKHLAEVKGVTFSPDGRLVITVSSDGKVWRWDLGLSPDPRPIEDLLLLAQLLDGHQMDAGGGFVPVETDTLKQLWHTLRARYPGDFIPRGQ